MGWGAHIVSIERRYTQLSIVLLWLGSILSAYFVHQMLINRRVGKRKPTTLWENPKTAWWVMVILCTCGALWAYKVSHEPSEPAFSVVCRTKMGSDSPADAPFFLLVANRAIYQVSMLMYVDFTNLRLNSQIASYRIEAETKRGFWKMWKEVELVDPRDYPLFFATTATSFTNAYQWCAVENYLSSRLRTNKIAQTDTVEGWVLLNGTNRLGNRMRMHIKDASRKSYVAETVVDDLPPEAFRAGATIRPINFTDLSKFPLIPIGTKFQ